jgi:YHS domain-containing protein
MNKHPLRQRRVAPGVSFVLAVICACAADVVVNAMEDDAIAWRDDYAGAFDEAKAANRPLWLQFTGPWCPNCTRMERDSFSRPAILQVARQSFVPVKLRSDIHEQLAVSFNLSTLPATVIVAPNRDVVATHQGYLGPIELDAFLRDSLSRLPGKPAESRPQPDKSSSAAPTSHQTRGNQEKEQLALSGYCPVSLILDKKLVRGHAHYSVRHEGRTYRFASRAASNTFSKEPDRFVPVNNESCPVTKLDGAKEVPGDPRWGVLYQSHLFLCASKEHRRRFLEQPDRFAMVDVAEEGFCPHCVRESGLLVRGDPRHEFARAGKRYWFPDDSHRDAYVASLR